MWGETSVSSTSIFKLDFGRSELCQGYPVQFEKEVRNKSGRMVPLR